MPETDKPHIKINETPEQREWSRQIAEATAARNRPPTGIAVPDSGALSHIRMGETQVDTSAEAVERLAERASRSWAVLNEEEHYEVAATLRALMRERDELYHRFNESEVHGTKLARAETRMAMRLSAAIARAERAEAERDGMHVDLNRAYAERQALEDRCIALRDERDALQAALDAINMESTNADR